MRHHTTPNFYELTSEGGGKSISITPAGAPQAGKFTINGVPPRIDDMRTYLTRFWFEVEIGVDTDAAGNAVSWDKLAKVLQSCEVISPILGVPYPHFHTQGATLMHIISVLALDYQYPQGARTQIPANTDADYTINQFYVVPFAQEFLQDPLETAQWAGFFDGGTIEGIVAASNVLNGDYDGAVTENCTLRCQAEVMPSNKEFIGVPFQWRRRQIAGGGQSPVLKNVGGETSLNGIAPGAGLAALYWLTNATGIGLGGPDGVDNITQVTLDWRNLKATQNLDGFYHYLRATKRRRTSPISQGTGAALLDTVDWPRTMDATGENRPSADPLQMFLPLVTPDCALHTSKLQRVLGDLRVDYNYTAAVTNAHEFMSLEFFEYKPAQAEAMRQQGLFAGTPTRPSLSGKPGKAGNFRYTPIEFKAAVPK